MQLTDKELDELFDLEYQRYCTEEETKNFHEGNERLLSEMGGIGQIFSREECDDGERRKKGSRI